METSQFREGDFTQGPHPFEVGASSILITSKGCAANSFQYGLLASTHCELSLGRLHLLRAVLHVAGLEGPLLRDSPVQEVYR